MDDHKKVTGMKMLASQLQDDKRVMKHMDDPLKLPEVNPPKVLSKERYPDLYKMPAEYQKVLKGESKLGVRSQSLSSAVNLKITIDAMEKEIRNTQPRDMLREMQEKGLIGQHVTLDNLLAEKKLKKGSFKSAHKTPKFERRKLSPASLRQVY